MQIQPQKTNIAEKQEFRAQIHAIHTYTMKLLKASDFQFLYQLQQLAETCKNLLRQVEHIIELETTTMCNSFPSKNGKTQDGKFLTKIVRVVEENLENENFGIKTLCETMLLSRTQLHRKIKKITGLSTTLYVRQLRLNKAKILLETTDFQVSEIAYQVGFKSSEYFSRKFSEAFGQPPSVFSAKKKQSRKLKQ